MKSKKSQTEILGLAIIVVLVILGILLYFKFKVAVKQDFVIDEVTTSILAENIVGAMLKTNTGCRGGQDFSDLIISCTEIKLYNFAGQDFNCDGGGPTYNKFLGDSVSDILNKTLKSIKKDKYEFKIEVGTDQIINPIGEGCLEWETGVQPLQTKFGNVIIKLRVCK